MERILWEEISFHDLVWRKNLHSDRRPGYGNLYVYCSGSRRFSGVAPAWLDELDHAIYRSFFEYTNSASDHFTAGYPGKCEHPQPVVCNRRDQLDQYCKSSTYRGSTDSKQRVHHRSKMYGSRVLPCLVEASGTNFFSSIMFMVVMNVRTAMISEATLSFMGIGLPIEVITWGSMLSLSDKALMTGSWWIILIPGLFLIATVLCLTNIGNACREQTNRKESNF